MFVGLTQNLIKYLKKFIECSCFEKQIPSYEREIYLENLTDINYKEEKCEFQAEMDKFIKKIF